MRYFKNCKGVLLPVLSWDDDPDLTEFSIVNIVTK